MRNARVSFFYTLWMLVVVSSCGEVGLQDKFAAAALKQRDLDSQTLQLWARSPTMDGSDATVTAASDLEQIPRAPLSFATLLKTDTALESADLAVVNNSSVTQITTDFYSWAGRRAPWNTEDFAMLMAFSHGTKALELAKKLFPTANYGFKIKNSSRQLVAAKLVIYAQESGNPFLTSYVPTTKSIAFYRDAQSATLPGYNPALEGDAIYHEVGHYLMHTLSCSNGSTCENSGGREGTPVASDLGTSPDMDSLQEGLADLFASVVARDDRTLSFFSNNARYLTTAQNRMGIEFDRAVNNRMRFPDGFRQQMHFDGRVIAGALNDFRKYLDGEGYQSVNCELNNLSSECRVSGMNPPLSKEEAGNTVIQLALDAFASMAIHSSYYDYVTVLERNCAASCPDAAVSAARLDIILRARGLLPTSAALSTAVSGVKFSSAQAEADIYVDEQLAWRPFPGSVYADSDSYLEPCELVMVYPDMRNVTNATNTDATPKTRLQIENITAELVSVSANGFTPAILGKTVLDYLPGVSSSYTSLKSLGWLNPGESFSALVEDKTSRLYTNSGKSTFTRVFGSGFNVPSVGWLVHAPSKFGATGNMVINFSATVFNQTLGTVFKSNSLTLSLSTITEASANAINAGQNPAPVHAFECAIANGRIQ